MIFIKSIFSNEKTINNYMETGKKIKLSAVGIKLKITYKVYLIVMWPNIQYVYSFLLWKSTILPRKI